MLICIFSHSLWKNQAMWNSIKVTSIRVVQPTTSQENPQQLSRFSSRIELFPRICGHYDHPTSALLIFLWGCLKKRMFQNETSIIGALKQDITNEIRQTDSTKLRRTIDNRQRRLAENGGHLSTEYDVNLFNMQQRMCLISNTFSSSVHDPWLNTWFSFYMNDLT